MKPQQVTSPRQPPRPEEVQQYLAELRKSQREISKFVGAVKELSERQSQTLEGFISNSSECIAGAQMDSRFRDACDRMLRRYLELARRRQMTIDPPEHCIPVFQELTKELRLNCATLKLSPNKLVTATLLSEKPLIELSQNRELAPFLSRFRGLVERAVTSNSADPHGYLCDVHSRFSVCKARELEHEALPLRERTLLFVAQTLRDYRPLTRLGLFRVKMKELLEAQEFRPISGLFQTDSARSRFIEGLLARLKEKDCRPYLSETSRLYKEIAGERSFEKLQSRRADILVAVLRHREKAKQFLKEMLEQEARITQLAERCGERLCAKEIRVLCLKTPRKAHEVETTLSKRSAEISGGEAVPR